MLYIVPTPIGNLKDITLRALDLLKSVKYIITEDSRNTRKLLNLLNIESNKKYIDITRNHTFNKDKIIFLLNKIKNKEIESVVLVSDSGTPCLSDPGKEVVDLCIEYDINYTVLPGANSVIPAIVGSGLVSKEFYYFGFFPIKKNRLSGWKKISSSDKPVVVLESKHRLLKFLQEAIIHLEPNSQICIINDISKMYEKYELYSIKELQQIDLQQWKIKGEYILVIKNKI